MLTSNPIEAFEDRNLLGQFLDDPGTWAAWLCFLRAFFASPPADGDLDLYRECTGRVEWPTGPALEAWVIAGRRSGKSYVAALLALFFSVFKTYQLSAGETGHVIVVSPTRDQSRIVKRYVAGFLAENAFFRGLLAGETAEEIRLNNRTSILVLSSDYRSLRGFTAIAGIVEEAAFLQGEGSRPDYEIVRALRPALATTGGPLIGISSPYAKRGVLYTAWKAHFAKDGDPVLVWQAPSVLMNPTLAQEVIERAKEEDSEAASSEWGGQFRSDIESFISREAVDAVVIPHRIELPPIGGIQYSAFTDPSGGGRDSFTLGIAHTSGERAVLDVLRERRPPFSPEQVVVEFAELLKTYRIREVTGDRYAGEWPREQFRKHGIEYRPSEKSKSELYLELLPAINSGRVELLDNSKMISQLAALERRTGRTGKDAVDHGPHGFDDVINAAAGVLVSVSRVRIMPGFFFIGPDRFNERRFLDGD